VHNVFDGKVDSHALLYYGKGVCSIPLVRRIERTCTRRLGCQALGVTCVAFCTVLRI
jgi:hypothetical protein